MYHIAMTQWIVGNEDLETSCKRLNRYHYDGIEFASEPKTADSKMYQEMMSKYKLNCHSLCGIFSEDRDLSASGEKSIQAIDYLKGSVDLARELGAKIIIVVPSPVGRTEIPAGKTEGEMYDNAVKNLKKAADYATGSDVHFAIEAINRYETYLINTVEAAYKMADDIDSPAVGVMADCFHMSIEESSFTQSLYRIKDKLLHVHIADNNRMPAGLGHTDFHEIIRTLNAIDYHGSLTMEFMYRLANPYHAKNIETQSELMDRYAEQAINYLRSVESSVCNE